MGSRYALALKEVCHEITLMARGKRLEQLQEYGVVVESLNTNLQLHANIRTINALKKDDRYDLALVIIHGNQVPDLIPAFQKNINIPIIIFLGNRIEGTQELIQAVGPERSI